MSSTQNGIKQNERRTRNQAENSGRNPSATKGVVPKPQIDTTGLVELASKLTEYYGDVFGKGYRVDKRTNPDGSMELVISPMSGDKRSFVISYAGQPDSQGFVSGTLKIDDDKTVAVRFHPKLGKNFMTEEDAKRFTEFLMGSGSGSGDSTKKQGNTAGSNEESQAGTFKLFNPLQQPTLLNLNPATGTTSNTTSERMPGIWEKLGDAFVNSLPFLIALLMMRSNQSED
jgi:hypothetical protein